MKLEWNDMCFGCGKANDCGLQLKISYEDGKAWADIVFKEHHQGWKNIVHGGVIVAAIDEVMAYTLGSMGVTSGVTVQISVRFKKPVVVGERYKVEARVVESKGRKYSLRGEITKDGIVYAEGEGIYLSVKEVKV